MLHSLVAGKLERANHQEQINWSLINTRKWNRSLVAGKRERANRQEQINWSLINTRKWNRSLVAGKRERANRQEHNNWPLITEFNKNNNNGIKIVKTSKKSASYLSVE
jgi:hypothetical protein